MNEEDQDQYQKLCWAVMQYLVNVGLMLTVMPQYLEHVQENFSERIDNMIAAVNEEAEIVQGFGESYDA